MARDFIFRIKPGEALPPRDPSGSRIIFNEQTRKFEILGADGSVVDLVDEGGGGIISGVTNHSQLTLDDGTNPHGTTAEDVGLGNVDNTSDLDKPISQLTQEALDRKVELPENSANVGPNQEYKSIQEAIDDDKLTINIIEDTVEPGNVVIPFVSPNDDIIDFVINIPNGVNLDMGDYTITVEDEDTALVVNCQGNIIWSPQTEKHLFNTLDEGDLFINNLNLDMRQGAADNCKISDGFFVNIFTGIHQVDFPNQSGCGYHTDFDAINFWDGTLFVIRNFFHFNPSSPIFDCIDVNGDGANVVILGLFNDSNSIAKINSKNVNLTIFDATNGIYNIDVNGGSVSSFNKKMLAGGSMDVNLTITEVNSQIKNVDISDPEVNGIIDVNNLANVLLENVKADSIINTNILTYQQNVINTSFSEFPYNRNIDFKEIYLENTVITNIPTMTPINELELILEVGWYRVEFEPFYNVGVASHGTGWDFGAGSAVITNYAFRGIFPNTSSTNFVRNYTNPDQNWSTTSTSRVNDNRASIVAEFQVTSAGNLIPRFRCQADDMTLELRPGTLIRYKKLNVPL